MFNLLTVVIHIIIISVSLTFSCTVLTGPALEYFRVAIGSENVHQTEQFQEINYKLCAAIDGSLRAGEKRLLKCRRNIRGRYVKIYMRRRSSLSICELEIREGLISLFLK